MLCCWVSGNLYPMAASGRRAVVIHIALGFTECPGEPMMLAVMLADIRATLTAATI